MMTVPKRGYIEIRGSRHTMDDLNPTTRRFPRTMEEAFKDPQQISQWWYPPEREMCWRDAVVFGVGFFAWLVLAVY